MAPSRLGTTITVPSPQSTSPLPVDSGSPDEPASPLEDSLDPPGSSEEEPSAGGELVPDEDELDESP